MAIEDWMDLDRVDGRRSNNLGGFLPGRGFGCSDEDDETLTASIEVDQDDVGEDTVPMAPTAARR
ncbi:MAG: hypothetical protein ABI592_00670 [Acidobacteriota bacterium]